MGNLANKLAKKLRELRGDIPQNRFARRLGISKSSLNRMELGDQNVSLTPFPFADSDPLTQEHTIRSESFP